MVPYALRKVDIRGIEKVKPLRNFFGGGLRGSGLWTTKMLIPPLKTTILVKIFAPENVGVLVTMTLYQGGVGRGMGPNAPDWWGFSEAPTSSVANS